MRVARLAGVLAAVVLGWGSPALAQDATLAPADASFGRYNLSILGIANSIRDAGVRIDSGADPNAVIGGPLASASDAMHAWEARYRNDPWLAKDIVALEMVYLKIPTEAAFRLASQTEAWLLADFPNSTYVAKARSLIETASIAPKPATPAAIAASPWERFAALRAPLAPR